MKKFLCVIASVCLLQTGCSSDADLSLESNQSLRQLSADIEELSYVEQLNAIGCPVSVLASNEIKEEATLNDGMEKVETSASEEIKLKVQEILERSYYKERTYLRVNDGEGLVGVLKNSSCGNYKELVIFMDCEDSKGHSWTLGWTGDSFVDSNKNMHLKICVIPTATHVFQQGRNEFAVLHLGGQVPTGISTITRLFDNENDKNENYKYTRYDGEEIRDQWIGQCYLSTDTQLAFLHYKSNGSIDKFPSLGISYGVFGRFGDAQGNIYTDDEDSGNHNSCYTTSPDGTQTPVNGMFGTILDAHKNTSLYTSMVQ